MGATLERAYALYYEFLEKENKVGEVEDLISKNLIDSEVGVGIIEGYLSQVSDGQMFGLTFAMTVIPAILLGICYYVLKKKYIIDEELYDKMIKEIKERESN